MKNSSRLDFSLNKLSSSNNNKTKKNTLKNKRHLYFCSNTDYHRPIYFFINLVPIKKKKKRVQAIFNTFWKTELFATVITLSIIVPHISYMSSSYKIIWSNDLFRIHKNKNLHIFLLYTHTVLGKKKLHELSLLDMESYLKRMKNFCSSYY